MLRLFGMQILPVLDMRCGVVVHGKGGQREQYRPLKSCLAASSDPLEVAYALRRQYGFSNLYVADLDALSGLEPQWESLTSLVNEGFRLWVDAGISDVTRAIELSAAGVDSVVVALETISGPDLLPALVNELGGNRLVFSLDLKWGRPISKSPAWEEMEPIIIAERAVKAGFQRILVLDLARVGMDTGTGQVALCRDLVARYPGIGISAGGGIRGLPDLQELERAGVKGALLASALHDGRLSAEDLRPFISVQTP